MPAFAAIAEDGANREQALFSQRPFFSKAPDLDVDIQRAWLAVFKSLSDSLKTRNWGGASGRRLISGSRRRCFDFSTPSSSDTHATRGVKNIPLWAASPRCNIRARCNNKERIHREAPTRLAASKSNQNPMKIPIKPYLLFLRLNGKRIIIARTAEIKLNAAAT